MLYQLSYLGFCLQGLRPEYELLPPKSEALPLEGRAKQRPYRGQSRAWQALRCRSQKSIPSTPIQLWPRVVILVAVFVCVGIAARNGVTAFEPPAKVNVSAAARAERPVLRRRGRSADRTFMLWLLLGHDILVLALSRDRLRRTSAN